MRLEITDLKDEGPDEKTATTESLNKGIKIHTCMVYFLVVLSFQNDMWLGKFV